MPNNRPLIASISIILVLIIQACTPAKLPTTQSVQPTAEPQVSITDRGKHPTSPDHGRFLIHQ